MTNSPSSQTGEPHVPPPAEPALVALARQISLDWWAVITALAFAVLVLIGLNIPW